MKRLIDTGIYFSLFLFFGISILGCTGMRQNAVRWALDRGDYTSAISHMQGLSKAEKYEVINSYCEDNSKEQENSPQSAVNYAYCIEKGLGDHDVDVQGAIELYTRAAGQGNVDAVNNLVRLNAPLPESATINGSEHSLRLIYSGPVPEVLFVPVKKE